MVSFTQLMPEYEIKDEFLRDLLKINFILVQNQSSLPTIFINYL
jgi:hypothetical protein